MDTDVTPIWNVVGCRFIAKEKKIQQIFTYIKHFKTFIVFNVFNIPKMSVKQITVIEQYSCKLMNAAKNVKQASAVEHYSS